MEPIPETAEALHQLTKYGDDTVADSLRRISRSVEEIVPQIVGISLSLVAENLTFTMTDRRRPVAEFDEVPDRVPTDDVRPPRAAPRDEPGPCDEDRWQISARATGAAGVESTLSLPILSGGMVVAGMDLYASTADAFEGHHGELALVSGAWAGGAVTNADLDFTTRAESAEAPDRLRTENREDQAVGALMSRWNLDIGEAEERLSEAARRAGITNAQMARAILGLLHRHPGTTDDDATDNDLQG